MRKVILIAIFLCVSFFNYAQNLTEKSESDMYSVFNKFFDAEIRRQGVKLNWIFRLEEITGLHTFDLDNDGLKEVLFEFSAVPVEGGGVTNSYAALFLETKVDKFTLGDYIETPYARFIEVEEKVFQFYNRKINAVESYIFEGGKFKKMEADK